MEMDNTDFSFDQSQPLMMKKLEAELEGDSPMVRGQEQSKTFRNRTANINIRRSLQLLDESVASPISLASRTPRRSGTLRHSSYTPISSGSKYDVTGLLGPTPRKTPSHGNQSFKQCDSLLFSGKTHLEDVTEEITTTNVGLMLEEDPGISACKGVYEEFQKCMKSNVSESRSFDLLTEYESVCKDHVDILRKLMKHTTRNELRFQKAFDMMDLIEQEKNTWQLVHSLLKDQLESELKVDLPGEEMDHDRQSFSRKSDRKIVSDFFEQNSEIRQSQLIVDWLENCALEKVESLRNNIKFFSDRAAGWENTLHKLQNRESASLFGGPDRPMVDEIDPDAAVRQNKTIDDLDKEDESRLLQTVFVYIRAGRLQESQDICREHGQAWRAATLEGWKLHHDPNFESVGEEGQIRAVEGNPYRDIWRNVCWNMAAEPRYDPYEKAVYGILSGNLRAVLPVCKGWLDFLWAHFKVLVDIKVEQELRTHKLSGRRMENMPVEFWDQSSDPESVFRRMEAYDDISKEGLDWYHVLQKWIILGDTEKLIEVMAAWVRQERVRVPQHLLRFMSHLVLFLRTTQRNVREDQCNVILEAFVEDLIHGDYKDLVAHYVATLPPDAQVIWYARFLEGVEDKDERQRCLDLAGDARLDIPQITKLVVENIRSRSAVDFSQNLDQKIDSSISEGDRKKIDALDWLVFDQSQRAEAMNQANAVMRSFTAIKKLHAAKEVFNKLPSDSIDVMVKMWKYQAGTADLPTQEANSIREYLCHRAYLNSMDSFNDWFNQYHHGKPIKPLLPGGASFTEKVAHEQQMKRYEQEVDRWRHHLDLQTKTTKGMIYNVLLFADGGWMVDQKQVVPPDDSRTHQMALLRQLVLPGLCFLLHNILHMSKQYSECLKMADLVASEQHGLYKVFRKDELQQLLRLLRDSSLANLNQNKGPLGHPSQMDLHPINI